MDINLFLNTRNCKNNSNYQPKFELPTLQRHGHSNMKLSFISAEIPNLRYTIHTGNQHLVFQENSTTTNITATLTPKEYTASQLATELKTQLDAEGSNTYTVSYDSQTKKFTITANSTNTFKIMSISTCLYEIGYEPMSSFETSKVGDYPVQLSGTHYIDIIVANLPTKCVSSDSRQNILARIPLTSGFGTICYYQEQHKHEIHLGDPEHLKDLEFELRDDQNRLFVLPATAYVSFQFSLKV